VRHNISKPKAISDSLLDVSAVLPIAERRETFALTSVKLRKTFQRVPQLDTLRGFLLVWMTLTHLPTRISPYSNQVVGYVSAAEGFILLAAILMGRIYENAPREKLWRRVIRIYGYHLALLAFAFSVCAAAAVYFHRIPLQNLLDFYLQHPRQALIAAPALIYNPPLLDILPMYIVFMLVTPLLLRIAEKRGWAAVLLGSGSLWLLAQFHLREWIYAGAAHFGFPIPLREMGAFDWSGWQFLWSIGLCLGSAKAAGLFSKVRVPRSVVLLSAAIAAILFLCRHTNFELLTGPAIFDALVNKWRLGIFRLIDAAAIGVLLVRFGSPLAATRVGTRLAVLGRASLEVFSAHLVFCIIFLGLATGPDATFTVWQDAIVLVVTLTGLFLVASAVDKHRKLARAAIVQCESAPLLRPHRQKSDSKNRSLSVSARSPA
jgi:hypothetical protein